MEFCDSRKKRSSNYVKVALVSFAIIICLYAPIKAEETVTIGMASFNFSFLPFQIAEEQGFYRKNNLKVQPVLMRSDVAIAALNSGNVDYITHFNGLIRAALVGFDMRVIFTTANKQMFSLVVQPEIRTVQDLKNKTIGVTSIGGFQHNITMRLLRAQGINPEKEINWVLASESVSMQQIKAKQMHAALLNPPLSIMLHNEGFRLLLHAGDYLDAPLTGLGAMTTKIREKPEQVKNVLRALYEAQQYIRTKKKETVDISARWLKMDSQTAANTYDLAVKTLSPDGTVSDNGIISSIEIVKEGARITKSFSPTDVADFSLLRGVLKEFEKKTM